MSEKEPLKRIAHILMHAQSVFITSHVRLDGDALGSEMAAYHALVAMGKRVVVYNEDKTPVMYRFLPGVDVIEREFDSSETFDAVLFLDCSDAQRAGQRASDITALGRHVITIDHHVSNDGFAEFSLVDHRASSTGELLYRLFREMDLSITKDIATNLHAAIVTDTGSFCYSNTGSETFRVAADLLDKGADVGLIAEHVYEMKPFARIALLGKVIKTFECAAGGMIGTGHVTRAMIKKVGALPEDTEGIVEMIRSIEGVRAAAFFQEMGPRYFKVSLRSRGSFDVEQVARRFGGGGHVNAAACRLEGAIADVKKKIVDAMRMTFQ